MSSRVVVIGDALLDTDLEGSATRLCPDGPAPVLVEPQAQSRPGGAGLAAALVAADGRPVTLVTALAADEAGRRLADLLARAGVEVVAAELHGATPAKVRIRAQGQSLARLDYGREAAVGALPEAASAAIADAATVLVADYGRGMAAHPAARAAMRPSSVIWDPHPRGAEPVGGARLVTPNAAEADHLMPRPAATTALAGRVRQASALAERWQAAGVAVTVGADGAVLVAGGAPLMVPAAQVPAGADRCGAGDRFAASVAAALADGAVTSEAVTRAVDDASAFITAGGPATLAAALDTVPVGTDPTVDGASMGNPTVDGASMDDATADAELTPPGPTAISGSASDDDADRRHVDGDRVVAATRSRGGTVVATGGCFDLLHAGHLRMLESARALGDCLIVCLNADPSVTALKGPGRPLMSVADRAALLRSLECVDAVVVFEERTPTTVLSHIRPDVWVKGGDYDPSQLPEADLVASWGGQAVVVPYLPGRSTSTLIEEVDRS